MKALHCYASPQISPNSTVLSQDCKSPGAHVGMIRLTKSSEGGPFEHTLLGRPQWPSCPGEQAEDGHGPADSQEGGMKVESRRSQSSADARFPSAVHGLQSPSFSLCLTLCLCGILSMQNTYYSINSSRELCYLRAWEGRK